MFCLTRLSFLVVGLLRNGALGPRPDDGQHRRTHSMGHLDTPVSPSMGFGIPFTKPAGSPSRLPYVFAFPDKDSLVCDRDLVYVMIHHKNITMYTIIRMQVGLHVCPWVVLSRVLLLSGFLL